MDTALDITLDSRALAQNLRHAKTSFAPEGALMMAVKSNAYGHGEELVVPLALESGVDELAVLDIATALRIRTLAPDTPLFAWLLSPHDDFAAAAEARVELGVSTLWQLDAIEKAGSHTPLTVHLKIDTGLHRNGATAEQWPDLVARAKQLEDAGLVRVRAVWSHLADTSIATSKAALQKLNDAAEAAKLAGLSPQALHLAASHAAVELPETRLDLVRLGILAYGVSPFDNHTARELGFDPVLTIYASVVRHEGSRVVLGGGFGHGLLRPVETATLPLPGATLTFAEMSADTTAWEVTGGNLPEIGQVLPLFGAHATVSVETWASWCHTIGDEVLAKLKPTLPRRFED